MRTTVGSGSAGSRSTWRDRARRGVAHGRLGRGKTYATLAHLGVGGAESWLHAAQEEGLVTLVPRTLDDGRRVHVLGLSPDGRAVLDGTRPVPTIGPPP